MFASNDEPRELLFEFRIGHRTVASEICYRKESGIEAQFVESDGHVSLRQRFPTRALAVEWAEQEQRAMEREETREIECGTRLMGSD